MHSRTDTVFDLTGKRVLITGASGGIGEQLAKAFFACGSELVLTGTRQERLVKIQKNFGEKCEIW